MPSILRRTLDQPQIALTVKMQGNTVVINTVSGFLSPQRIGSARGAESALSAVSVIVIFLISKRAAVARYLTYLASSNQTPQNRLQNFSLDALVVVKIVQFADPMDADGETNGFRIDIRYA